MWWLLKRKLLNRLTNYTATYLPSRKLSKLDEPDMQDTAGEVGTMYSYGPSHMSEQKQDGQLEHTYSSSVRIQDVALKTCQRRWTIGRSGERGSGISVLAAWHDDNDYTVTLCQLVGVLFGLIITKSLSSSIPIIHRFCLVLQTTSCFHTELMWINSR